MSIVTDFSEIAKRANRMEQKAELDKATNGVTSGSFTLASPSYLTLANVAPSHITIHGGTDKGTLVTINLSDGSIVFGEHYTPDEAAKVFWEAVSRYRRC